MLVPDGDTREAMSEAKGMKDLCNDTLQMLRQSVVLSCSGYVCKLRSSALSLAGMQDGT
jgi:hypothetical protein